MSFVCICVCELVFPYTLRENMEFSLPYIHGKGIRLEQLTGFQV